MFDTLPETRKVRVEGRWKTAWVAVGIHALGFLALAVSNAIAVQPLEPPTISVVFLSAAAPPPPPPPPAARKPKPKEPKPEATPNPVLKPVEVPDIVQPEVVPEVLPDVLDAADGGVDDGYEGVDGGVEGGIEGGVEGGTVGGVDGGVVDDEPLRVGGDVEPPQIIKQVKPRYPEVAKAAKVQGVVILETIINTEGRIEDVRVLRGHPLLEEAAKEAIVKWQFKPGRLNGKPVKVYFTLTVNFTLK